MHGLVASAGCPPPTKILAKPVYLDTWRERQEARNPRTHALNKFTINGALYRTHEMEHNDNTRVVKLHELSSSSFME